LLPVREAGALARRHSASSGDNCLLLVDTAQTAGAYPIDMNADLIDLLAFTGHKALGGPMGTGGLIIGERVDLHRLAPLKRGGTGSRSESELQPEFLPDVYESGTANAVGLAGLAAGVRWILEQGVEAIRQHEAELTERLLTGLQEIDGVKVHGGLDATHQTATVSFNVEGLEPSEVGQRLDDDYDLMCRVGLHCAPAAHKTLGTFPSGSVRFGLGAFNTLSEVDTALSAVETIAREGK
jgi:selenocysteine lyase/cysteine desulfurase